MQQAPSTNKTQVERRMSASMDESTIWDATPDVNSSIPSEALPCVDLARALVAESIHDAMAMKKDINWKDAVNWLFYSEDDQPWSLAYVMDILGASGGIQISSAQSRMNMLDNPTLLKAKQEFDLMVIKYNRAQDGVAVGTQVAIDLDRKTGTHN